MSTKKILSISLIAGILSMNYMPNLAYAAFINKKKVIQAQINEYKFQNVNLDWWKSYNDEYLEGYIVKAIDNSQDLKIATLRVEEAKQMVKLQFSKELPSAYVGALDLQAKMPDNLSTLTGASRSENYFGMPLIVNYEADIFGKNHDKTKSAKKNYETSKLNERAVYIAVASQIGATYFNIVKLDKLISIQNDIIKERKQIFDLMKERNHHGITSTADETRAQKAYVMAVADLTDLKKAQSILLNSLAVMTGESPNNAKELKRVSYEELPCCKPIPDEISSDIIVQRPDYMAAEKQVEKAGIDVKIAKKEFLPTVNLSGLLFFNSNSLGGSFNWENAVAALGGAAIMPIFTGGQKTANLRLKKNEYEQVLQKYYKTNLTAIQEVNDALSSLKLDNERYEKNLNSYNMQKDDYNYMKIRYKQGIISNLDLLQQKETLLSMNKMVVSSKTDCYINQISLYKAVGGKI